MKIPGESGFEKSRYKWEIKSLRHMLSNAELEMWEFSPLGIFDMWECEQITGSPVNSLYLRRD